MKKAVLTGVILALAVWCMPCVLVAQVSGFEPRIQRALDALKTEPSVREVQEAALRYFRVNTDQVNSMRSRASMKAAVPVFEVSGGFTHSDLGEDTRNFEKIVGPTPGNPEGLWIDRSADGNGFDVRGKLSWNFPQLVFNAEELDVASLAGLVEGLLKESTRLYYMRRRLQVDMVLTPPADQASLLTKQLRLEELTGLIDAMTGGWFSETLVERESRMEVSAKKRLEDMGTRTVE
jgi:hypothetical protein